MPPAPALFRAQSLSGPDRGPLLVLTGLLAAGNALFLLRMLAHPALGLLACLLMLATLWPLLRVKGGEPSARPDYRLWLFCLAAALLLLLLGGEGRIFFANADWQNRDALLADLALRPWPAVYRGIDGGDWVLRGHLGMYVLPASAAGLAGWPLAHPLLLAQNTAMLAAALAVFLSATRRWGARILVVAVLAAFSGWDIVGQLLFNHFAQPPAWAHLFPHLENWARGLQYSSLITGLFWVPHHALAAWAMAAAYLSWRRGAASSLHLAAIAALCVLWSPLAVIGAAPFALLALIEDYRGGRIGLLAPARLAPLALALAPAAVYLTLSAGTVAHGGNLAEPLFFERYLFVILLEVAPLLYLARRRADQAALPPADWWLAGVLLLLFPLVRIGQANDFMMRSSIMSIVILAVMASQALADDLAPGRRRRLALPLLVLAIGAATPAAEVIRAVATPVNRPRTDGFITAWARSDFRDYSKAPYLAPLTDYARWRRLLKQPPAALTP